MRIRPAIERDVASLIAFDHVACQSSDRHDLVRRSVQEGHCFVFEESERVLAYVVLDYSFYGNGFVAILYVHPERRRQGIGHRLVQRAEAECRTSKLFTSTNRSNVPMQSLLAKLGYQVTGIIYNLDPGDPELVYYKPLNPPAASS
jgi:ribosomal protein S18 acetylase RimI-like enzyme